MHPFTTKSPRRKEGLKTKFFHRIELNLCSSVAELDIFGSTAFAQDAVKDGGNGQENLFLENGKIFLQAVCRYFMDVKLPKLGEGADSASWSTSS